MGGLSVGVSPVGEVLPARGGPGSVVLDIGADVGAAVVQGPAGLQGREIEIRSLGAPWDGHHVAFRPWDTAAGPVVAAVFGGLTEGRWEARLLGGSGHSGGAISVAIEVSGGRVTTVAYPG